MIAANIKTFIVGEWLHHIQEKTLTHFFASNHELAEQGLIDAEGYLSENFKAEIREALGAAVLENVQGPFGDDDIFSGDIFDEETRYNIELHNVSDENLEALKNNHNVTITTVDK